MAGDDTESFWNPSRPIVYAGAAKPLFPRRVCYIWLGCTVLISWLIVIGGFLGWEIPPLLKDAGRVWWHWVLLVVVGFPLAFALFIFGFAWLSLTTDHTATIAGTLQFVPMQPNGPDGLPAATIVVLATVNLSTTTTDSLSSILDTIVIPYDCWVHFKPSAGTTFAGTKYAWLRFPHTRTY